MAPNMQVLTSIETQDVCDSIFGQKVLLAGETIMAGLHRFTQAGFVEVPAREAVAGLLAQFSRDSAKVYLAVDERLFGLPKVRFGLTVEGYLSWGLKERRKGTTVLFGGGESPSSVNVNIMVFQDGRVIRIYEKVLPDTQSNEFRDALQSMLAEMRITYPTAHFVQAAPLSPWNQEGIAFIGDKPLANLSYRPLSRTVDKGSAWLAPAGMASLGLVFYIGMTTIGWNQYSVAIRAYDTAVSDPSIKRQGGIDTGILDKINARRLYMGEARRQVLLANQAASVVMGIGTVPGVKIVEMRLSAPSDPASAQIGVATGPAAEQLRREISPERLPDVLLSISVPKSGESALDQAKAVMTLIANATGMSLRLAHQGWHDDRSQRLFTIEGFIHED